MLTNTPVTPRWPVAIVAAKSLDDPSFIEEMIGGHVGSISHVYTNGASKLVTDFARDNGIPCTVLPIQGRGLPASTRDIVAASQFVYIIETPDSKSAKQVVKICEERKKRDPTFTGHRVYQHDPATVWREKVGKVAEILACMGKDDMAANAWAQAVWKAVS